MQRFELRLAGKSLRFQELGHPHDRIPGRFLRALFRCFVQALVIGERMRIGADDLRVDERWSPARAGVGQRLLDRGVRGQEIGAVDALDEQVRERGHQFRDVAARGLHFHGHRDRVAVVLDDDDYREPAKAGVVQRLPELTLARGAVSERQVGDLVLLEGFFAILDVGDLLVQISGLSAPDGLQTLGSGRTRLRDDVEALVAPVRGHLPSAGAGVVFRADRAQQHLQRRDAERQAQRSIPVVRIEPVVSGLQAQTRGGDDRLVAGAADLEEDEALTLELNFFVVELPRQHHRAVGPKQFLARQAQRAGALAVADCRTLHARRVPFLPCAHRGRGGPSCPVKARL